MSDVLPVPHFQQSSEGFCLPACARMILGYLGLEQDEASVGQILGAKNMVHPAPQLKD